METNYTLGSFFFKLKNVLFKIRIYHMKRFPDTSRNRPYLKNETVIKIMWVALKAERKVPQGSVRTSSKKKWTSVVKAKEA